MANAQSRLPQITKFLAGLITNRNLIDIPTSQVGLQTVIHHDALIDGQNMEVSALGTIQRRPGYTDATSITPIPINNAVDDFWSYKDLTGTISYFFEAASKALFQGVTQVVSASGISFPWTIQGRGNFVYATAGDANQFRFVNTALTTPTQMGITPPTQPLSITVNPLFYYSVVSGFAPSGDNINGVIQVTDGASSRTMTITVTSGNVHFNVTYTGGVISTVQSYTEVSTLTTVGSTTTNVVTITNGFQDTITGAGITNGVASYYPSTGTATLDFDVSATTTIAGVVTAIHTAFGVSLSGFSNVPTNIRPFLVVFMDATLVQGLVSPLGQAPVSANTGVAINMLTNSGFVANQLQVNSGLQDTTNPQFSLGMKVGSAPRLYSYQSPLANITDTFTGSFTLKVVGASTVSHTITASAVTLSGIVGLVNSAFSGGGLQAIYVKNGTTAYALIRSVSATSPSTTRDVVVTMEGNTLVNNADTNENFTSWIFTSSNDWAQLPQQEIQLSYSLRDIVSGGLSNIAPSVTVGQQLSPIRWLYGYPGGTLPTNYAVELYRTVDGGSSFLYEQNMIAASQTFTILDDGLNNQLLGPIDEVNDPPPRGLRNMIYHTDRMFGIVDDRVYYSGGPDTVNGNGDESWPPGNFFQYPGTLVDLKSTAWGLIVSTTSDLHRISGVDSSSYYSQPWLRGFGIQVNTAWDYNGQSLYVYTSRGQFHSLSASSGKEIGFKIGNIISNFGAAVSVAFHRASALETFVMLSSSTQAFRYDPIRDIWSTRASGGGQRFKSLETPNSGYLLFNGVNGSPAVRFRDVTVFADIDIPYSAFITIGIMNLTPLGTHTALESISGYFTAVGSVPTVSVLLNEIAATTAVPFLTLFQPINEPVNGRPPQSIFAKRWSIRNTIQTFPDGWGLVNLASVKFTFPAENAKNEILGVFLRDTI